MTGEQGRVVATPTGRGLRLPDFIIGGAPRCGTTWLYRALERHPGIALAQPVRPEPKFFLVDSEYEKGLAYYAERWFSPLPAGLPAGEKSTNYFESPVAAARVAGAVPGVKLVFLLREPASRALSNYRFSRMHGLEDLDFATALAEESRRAAGYEERFRFSRPFSYYSRGLYAEHLSTWLGLFPREHILVRPYEDIVSRPAELLVAVQEFLGVPPRPEDVEGLGIVNAAEGADEPELRDVLASLRGRYEEPNRHLEDLLGDDLWSVPVGAAVHG